MEVGGNSFLHSSEVLGSLDVTLSSPWARVVAVAASPSAAVGNTCVVRTQGSSGGIFLHSGQWESHATKTKLNKTPSDLIKKQPRI